MKIWKNLFGKNDKIHASVIAIKDIFGNRLLSELGWINPVELGEDANLNNLNTNGWHLKPSSRFTIGASEQNFPVNRGMFILSFEYLFNSNPRCYQLAITLEPKIYVRVLGPGGWTGWKEYS